MSKKIIIIAIILGVVATAAIFLDQRYQFVNPAAENTENCDDGRGSDYYFDKNELSGVDDVSAFYPDKILASAEQECSTVTYQIQKKGTLKPVPYDEFYEYISLYDHSCDGCLMIYRDGWPYFGKIFKAFSDKIICGSGRNAEGGGGCVEANEL